MSVVFVNKSASNPVTMDTISRDQSTAPDSSPTSLLPNIPTLSEPTSYPQNRGHYMVHRRTISGGPLSNQGLESREPIRNRVYGHRKTLSSGPELSRVYLERNITRDLGAFSRGRARDSSTFSRTDSLRDGVISRSTSSGESLAPRRSDLRLSEKMSHKRDSSGSFMLFEVEDSLRKPLCGILLKAPFFDKKNYQKGRGLFSKWTMKMVKFDSESGVLSYCDAESYQKSNQGTAEVPTVMIGQCQYLHVGVETRCTSVPDMDNYEKSHYVFRLEYLTGVYDKSLFLASSTPEDRLKWVTRIQNYTQHQQLDRTKLREYQGLKDTIAEQGRKMKTLSGEVEDLVDVSGYLKGQVEKYQTLALKMRRENLRLIEKLDVVSREISSLKTSLKETTADNQIRHLDILGGSGGGPPPETSPEVEMLEQFARYLDFKRNDMIRASSRGGGGGEDSPIGDSYSEGEGMQNDLS